MKKLKSTISNVILIAFTISTIISCSGDDGKDGVNGTNGETGTANVMYSNWIDQNWNGENFPNIKRMDILEPRLTNDFIQNGIVLGYFRFGINYQEPLPYNLDYGVGFNIKRSFYAFSDNPNSGNPGHVFFYAMSNDAQPINSTYLNGNSGDNPQYRYIMIPGGIDINGKTKEDYSKMSYQEICKKFNIPQ